MERLRDLAVCVFLLSGALLWAQESVVSTVHNLSRSGPGKIKSRTEENACRFCHVPHDSSPDVPLWGHSISNTTYKTYRSKSLQSDVPQPNGASKLCLSCHDGTLALGDLVSRHLDLGPLSATSGGYIGTDLSGGHPVSMVVSTVVINMNNQDGMMLKDLETMNSDVDGVSLDAENRMQCTTCHDPHSDKYFSSSGIRFWRKTTFSEACLVCHTP